MKRRDFIIQNAKRFGYTVCGASVMPLIHGCGTQKSSSPSQLNSTPFNTHEEQTLNVIADIILPKTETPSATEVGTIEFLMTFVEQVFTPNQRQDFFTGLTSFRDNVQMQTKRDFLDLTLNEQTQIINTLDISSFDHNQSTTPANMFYQHAKRLTVLGYYQSETIGETVLNYDPIPGGFIHCMPYDGKVMSLN